MSSKPILVHTKSELAARVDAARQSGRRIGLVPTMGALHEGHVSLAQHACQSCDFNVVSIFVNPTQFGPHEDFDRYPRTLDADLAALSTCAIDLVYAPPASEMYPTGFATLVEPGGVALPLEGARRPGHFRGVATVVLKLFEQARPDVAFFGRKDFQQTLVVRQMTRDLDLPVRVEVCPTVREPDGLALSSRNRYLRADEREQAPVLFRSLRLAAELIDGGQRDARVILDQMRALIASAPLVQLDYLVLADPDTLADVQVVEHPTVAAVAARLGATRLIDNDQIGEWLPRPAGD
jgi:pantoate--beta-alanine ligase